MPKIFEFKGYKFFFFSNEGSPLKPSHIHVRKDNRIAKFWLYPSVMLAYSWGMKSPELKMLRDVVEQNKEEFDKRWNDYFG